MNEETRVWREGEITLRISQTLSFSFFNLLQDRRLTKLSLHFATAKFHFKLRIMQDNERQDPQLSADERRSDLTSDEGSMELFTVSSDSDEVFPFLTPPILNGEEEMNYRFRVGGPLTPQANELLAMPMEAESEPDVQLPQLEGSALERELFAIIEEEMELPPISPVSNVDIEREANS